MIALNVYKNVYRSKLRNYAGPLAHLNNIASNSSSSFCNKHTNSRLLEKPVFQQCRFCSSSSSSQSQPGVRLPALSDFPVAIWPTIFKTIRNFFFVNMVIVPHFDNEFNMNEFMTASKQAVQVVSHALGREDYDQLEGLVTNDIIQSLKQKISTLNDRQKELIAINQHDIYMVFPYEVGIISDGEKEGGRRFVEIMVVMHSLRGLSEMRARGESPPMNLGLLPEYQERIFLCNYRFHREYTKGVDSSWIINMINHVMPVTLVSPKNSQTTKIKS